MEFNPHAYQRYAIDYIKNHPKCGLWLDMRLRKTTITLHAIKELRESRQLPRGHILVVAPKPVCINTWPDEIKKWDGFENINLISLVQKRSKRKNKNGEYDMVRLQKKERDVLFDRIPNEVPSIYLINRELLSTLIEYSLKHHKQWCFPTVILDEMHRFKSYSSKRFKSLKKVLPYVDRLIGLTGTPATNNLQDVWSQIYLLDSGERLGRTITAYRERFFWPRRVTAAGRYPYEWIPKYEAEEEIFRLIDDIVISMKNTLPLPPVTYNDITWQMSKEQKALYNKFKKERVLELNKDVEITADNAAVLAAKLSQLASGSIYIENRSRDFIEIHDIKLQMLEEILNEAQRNPILCFYWFNSDKERILKKFPQAVAFSGESHIKEKWDNNEIELMICQPASVRMGLNLQESACRSVVWFNPIWNLENYLQGNKRVHRQRQTHPITIHHLIIKGTIDDRIMKALQKKDDFQNELLNAVRVELSDAD